MNWQFQKLFFTLFPGQCVCCKASSKRHIDLCFGCQRDLPYVQNACWQCGLFSAASADLCNKCIAAPPVYSHCYSLLTYSKPVGHLINEFKNHNQLAIGRVLSTLLGHKYKKSHISKPDIWLPVPLHESTINARGFNQASEIAQVLSRTTQTPWSEKGLKRTRKTLQQKKLNINERADNMFEAFTISLNVLGLKVGVVDDVITTGATVSSFTNTILEAGARDVQVVSLARTPEM